ncbi:acyltransferase family protein [Sporolactobacillus kofuensis]|uniref:Acyltransferase family protein n=1 Tax=Sporolactobacillus kofuensis TaxID=269672 RepID=A0ABW1WGG3_9BACL|nr:acyltransferase family protein [Sporolactobacillus kofuensis]MCO7177119.1 acyltransferase family protein [Sporolactobacillus kofuensis]
MTERQTWLDSVKGIAIILVVLGHAALGLLLTNKTTSDRQFLTVIHDFIYTFHMPLFFVVSGYLYGLTRRINNWNSYFIFSKKKLLAIGIPYIIFSVIQVTLSIVGGSIVREPLTIRDLVLIPIFPVQYLWFLYVLLFLFLFLALLDRLIKRQLIVFLIVIVLNIVGWYWNSDIYLINALFADSIYFYIGKLLVGRSQLIKKGIFSLGIMILFGVLVIIHFFFNTPLLGIGLLRVSEGSQIFPSIMLSVITAISGSLLIMSISIKFIKSKFIQYLGRESMVIYLLSENVTTLIRAILFKVGITGGIEQFLIGSIVALFGSIVIYKIIAKIKLFDFMFYPTRYLRLR